MRRSKKPVPDLVQPDGFFEALVASLCDDDLKEIACADYGIGKAEHFQHLKTIVDVSSIPLPIRWHPWEVLELYGWSEPNLGSSFAEIRAFHRRRAFCLVVQLVAAVSPNGPFISHSHIINLIKSLDAMDAGRGGFGFLWWLSTSLDDPQNCVFTAIGALYLGLSLNDNRPSELATVIDWLMSMEATVAAEDRHTGVASEWLRYKGRADTAWRRLGAGLLDRVAELRFAILEDDVRLIISTLLA